MTVNKELLSILLEEYPQWGDSATNFLLFITMFDFLVQLETNTDKIELLRLSAYGEELADLLLLHFQVNISPYNSFEELKVHYQPDQDAVRHAYALLDKARSDIDFYDVLEDAGAVPSIETVTAELLNDFTARRVIDKLSHYVTFR